MLPRIGKRAILPLCLLSPIQVRKARKSLLYKEYKVSRVDSIKADLSDDDEAKPHGELVTVNEFRLRRGVVSLPRAYARSCLSGICFKDNTVFPKNLTQTPRDKITPRDARQKDFFDVLLKEAQMPGPVDILANATTGAGKTVVSIYVGTELNTPTLIIVDSNKIANGWLKNFIKFYGEEWTKKYVGRIQQDSCDYIRKPFSIALVQSLARRKYPAAFYRAWGCIIHDEVQIFAASHYSKVLSQFSAKVKIGLTATNKTGGLGGVITAQLGKPKVVSSQTVMQPEVHTLQNELESAFYCESDGALLSGLSKVRKRNEKLAKLIKVRGVDRGRCCLVLSNRTAQLSAIKHLLVGLGVDASSIGMHTGSYLTDRFVVYYAYAGSTKRNRLTISSNRATASTIIRKLNKGELPGNVDMPKPAYNRWQAGELITFSLERETYKPSQTELDNITNLCDTILATYEIFNKGVDVPRIDMGVEALPSGAVIQPLGRVTRIHPDKPTPEWYAIEDYITDCTAQELGIQYEASILNEFFRAKTQTRNTGFRKINARVIRHGKKNKKTQ